jgi:RNA polymerase sigma-70 factor (ECF subfamily)
MVATQPVLSAVADAHRREWARVLAATVRVTGDLDLAQQSAQDAFVAALDSWDRDGIPDKPGAWLTTTARRKALDVRRREKTLQTKLPLLIEPAGSGAEDETDMPDASEIEDDRLRLVFTCCHPALAREAQVALTLRLVCGISTAEIAKAFLVSEATMAARVTRAKKKIAVARIPYRVPTGDELPDRLDAVLTTVHLLFTSGHTAAVGEELVRADLVGRALDLGRLLVVLMPDEREVRGLLALMLLTDARRRTRVSPSGEVVLLEEQDRSLWDRAEIDEGEQLVRGALRGGRPGRFALQAAVVGVHDAAATYQQTDWPQIVGLYDALLTVWSSPVVELNRAVAVAMAHGPAAGLAALERIDASALRAYAYLPATRADLLRRLGERAAAAAAYRAAIALTDNAAERAFLTRRLAEVADQRQATC